MARPNKRVKVIEAAMQVAEREGLAAVTIDAVADHADMTNGGLLYHCPTRQALLVAIYTHMANEWETELLSALDTPFETATGTDRLRAYIRVAARPMTRAELVYLADAGSNADYFAPWQEITNRWLSPLPGTREENTHNHWAAIARLAADGLWSHDALTGARISVETRAQLAEQILTLLDE